jgi:hypothetical protein
MINPFELRLGNCIYDEEQDKNDLVIGIEEERLSLLNGILPYTAIDFIHPILLTEEWLIKFGFNRIKRKHYTGDYFEFTYNSFYLLLMDIGFQFYVEDEINTNSINLELIFVHQLQNLYWCLYGEELNIVL